MMSLGDTVLAMVEADDHGTAWNSTKRGIGARRDKALDDSL